MQDKVNYPNTTSLKNTLLKNLLKIIMFAFSTLKQDIKKYGFIFAKINTSNELFPKLTLKQRVPVTVLCIPLRSSKSVVSRLTNALISKHFMNVFKMY